MSASGKGPQITAAEASVLEAGRARMMARHKLIDGMIRNNELQLKNEAARGGAEIERECARRDAALPGAGPVEAAALAAIAKSIKALDGERRRLLTEREWLDMSLMEFDTGPEGKDKRTGHA